MGLSMADYRAVPTLSLTDSYRAMETIVRQSGRVPDDLPLVRAEIIRRMTKAAPGATTAADFGELLAQFRALSLYYQQIHWVSSGADFYEDHLLAERLYNDAAGVLDEIAEKGIAATGRSFVLLPDHLARVAQIVGAYPNSTDVDAMFAASLIFERNLGRMVDDLFHAEDLAGVSDLFASLASDGLQRIYLLEGRQTQG